MLIYGASCRAAAQCAKRSGANVCAIDLFGDRDLVEVARTRVVERLDAIEELFPVPTGVGDLGVKASDLVVLGKGTHPLLMLAGGAENHPHVVDYLISQGYRSGVDGDRIHTMRSLDNWLRWGAAADVAMPTTYPIGSMVDRNGQRYPGRPNSHQLVSGKGRWIEKSYSSAGGLGISSVVETGAGATGVVVNESSGDSESNRYIQQFLHGTSIGVTFLTSNAETWVIGATESWNANDVWGPSEFIYRGSIGPIALSDTHCHRLQDFGNVVGSDTGVQGLWQADFIIDSDGLHLLEINPRWTAGMEVVDICSPVSLFHLHQRCVEENVESRVELKDLDWFTRSLRGQVASTERQSRMDGGAAFAVEAGRSMVGKLVVYANSELVPSVGLLEKWWNQRWSGEVGSLFGSVLLADIPNTTSPIPRGYPILTCMTGGTDRQEVLERLKLVANFIRTTHRS